MASHLDWACEHAVCARLQRMKLFLVFIFSYAAGQFRIDIKVPADYPFKPPVLKVVTKVYHPNIDDDGNVCLAILKSDAWKPATHIVDGKLIHGRIL